VLVQCDPSIKAMICRIDEIAQEKFIIEDLDDETVVVKESKLAQLKDELNKVHRAELVTGPLGLYSSSP